MHPFLISLNISPALWCWFNAVCLGLAVQSFSNKQRYHTSYGKLTSAPLTELLIKA